MTGEELRDIVDAWTANAEKSAQTEKFDGEKAAGEPD